MAFDTNAGVSAGSTGASIGSIGGPIGAGIGAAAGFVLGGFLGGSYASGNKKRQRTLERKIRRRQSPQYFASKVAEYTPLARRTVLESGAANTLQQEVQGNISRRGLTGTGLGTAFQNAAALAPSQFAAQTATTLAQNSIDSEINSIMSMGTYNPKEISTLSRQSAGDIATAIAIFRSLKGRNSTNPSSNQGNQLGIGGPAAYGASRGVANPGAPPPYPTTTPRFFPGATGALG